METQGNKSLAEYAFSKRKVRIIEINGSVWWAATDVVRILGYKTVSHAVDPLDDYEKTIVARNDFLANDSAKLAESKKRGGAQSLIFVNESGLYNLIFRSTLPVAKAFKRWVFEEVLPSIRRQGYYVLEKQIAEIQKELDDSSVEIYYLKKKTDDPKEMEKIALRRYIMNRFCSMDIHHYEDGEREYYIYAGNEQYVSAKEEFIAQVFHCFPEAKIKKVRKRWQFWGVGHNLAYGH
jgi:prophage antirepressor-like protein